MPSITFNGMASGLPPNIVDQLMDAERMPIKTIQTQKGKSEERLKLVSELETKVSDIRKGLSELADARGFSDIKLNSGDPNIVQGVVDPQFAQPGSWNVEVVQLAQKAAAITNGFPDKDKTEIGVGYFKFKTPDGNKDVYISAKNNTLEGAALAINNSRLGMHASVLNDRKDPDAPFKLMITSDNVGSDNKVEYPTLYFLDGDQDIYFDTQKEAANGIIKVDGFEIEVPDNTLKDVIPGVTLDLKQAAPGRSVNVSVKEDLQVVSGKIKTFVDGFNAVLGFIQTQNKLDKSTDTTKTLGGDGMLRSIENRLRNLIQTPQYGLKGPVQTLSQLGIAFNRNGTLDFEQKKFDSTLAKNPEAVHSFLVGDGFSTGFITSVKREVANLLNGVFGPISNRKKGLQQKIEQFDQRIEQKERQLGRKEEQLRAKFSRLEETMSKLKAQGSGLAALGNMGGGGAGG